MSDPAWRARLHNAIADGLDDIKRRSLTDSYRVTLIARCVDMDDADIVVTDDEIDEAVGAALRLYAKEPKR